MKFSLYVRFNSSGARNPVIHDGYGNYEHRHYIRRPSQMSMEEVAGAITAFSRVENPDDVWFEVAQCPAS